MCRRSRSQDLPTAAESAKIAGNEAFFERDYNATVWHYTKVLFDFVNETITCVLLILIILALWPSELLLNSHPMLFNCKTMWHSQFKCAFLSCRCRHWFLSSENGLHRFSSFWRWTAPNHSYPCDPKSVVQHIKSLSRSSPLHCKICTSWNM